MNTGNNIAKRRKELGRKLYQSRNDMGLSQVSVANQLGIKQSLISKYENGDLLPNVFTLAEFARLYNKSIEQLIN